MRGGSGATPRVPPTAEPDHGVTLTLTLTLTLATDCGARPRRGACPRALDGALRASDQTREVYASQQTGGSRRAWVHARGLAHTRGAHDSSEHVRASLRCSAPRGHTLTPSSGCAQSHLRLRTSHCHLVGARASERHTRIDLRTFGVSMTH